MYYILTVLFCHSTPPHDTNPIQVFLYPIGISKTMNKMRNTERERGEKVDSILILGFRQK